MQHVNCLEEAMDGRVDETSEDGGENIPWNSKSAFHAFLASFFSHSSFSLIAHSQFFCLSMSSPHSSTSAFSQSISASLCCFLSCMRLQMVFFNLADSSITEVQLASADNCCNSNEEWKWLLTREKRHDSPFLLWAATTLLAFPPLSWSSFQCYHVPHLVHDSGCLLCHLPGLGRFCLGFVINLWNSYALLGLYFQGNGGDRQKNGV